MNTDYAGHFKQGYSYRRVGDVLPWRCIEEIDVSFSWSEWVEICFTEGLKTNGEHTDDFQPFRIFCHVSSTTASFLGTFSKTLFWQPRDYLLTGNDVDIPFLSHAYRGRETEV